MLNSSMNGANGVPSNFVTLPGPRPTIDPTAPTRPAYGVNIPDHATFVMLSDSDKLNYLYLQNTAILVGQQNMHEVLVRMVRNQETHLSALTEQIKLQHQTMGLMQNHLSSFNRLSIASAFIELEEDKEERAAKKDNAVLFGLAEPKQGEATDLDVVKHAFSAAGADPSVVTDVARLGEIRGAGAKPRPIKIYTNSFDDKSKVLKAQKTIFSTVPDFATRSDRPFFRNDLSKIQRENDYQLRNQLRQVRQQNPGGQFIISGGKIIPKSNFGAPM